MPLILRVDVDKPYGRHTFPRKVLSKLVEDYVHNLPPQKGYLSHLKTFIRYCNTHGVKGHFFHRLCTSPDSETLALYAAGGHRFGLHLENSRSRDHLKNEMDQLRKRCHREDISTFSKHGSGQQKLGKFHYAPYEPELYKKWAEELGYQFHSGNGTAEVPAALEAKNGFHEQLFWMEPYYRYPGFNRLDSLIKYAKTGDGVILIHPCNYLADTDTAADFRKLVSMAQQEGIEWKQV